VLRVRVRARSYGLKFELKTKSVFPSIFTYETKVIGNYGMFNHESPIKLEDTFVIYGVNGHLK